MLSNRISRHLLPALALMCCRADLVSARGFDGVEVHGFATQGYIKTSANSFSATARMAASNLPNSG